MSQENQFGKAEVAARPASTLLLLRERGGLEILMVTRNDRGMFANAVVFPGGMVEPTDQGEHWLPSLQGHDGLDSLSRGLRIAAARELWEETQVILGSATGAMAEAPDSPCPFQRHLCSRGHSLDIGTIIPFSNWVTPVGPPKRYDTHFFIAVLEDDQTGRSDGVETVDLEWANPRELLARDDREELHLHLATRGNLELLARHDKAEEAMAAASQRKIMPVSPIMRMIDGERHVTVAPGTPFGDLRVPVRRIQQRKKARPPSQQG